MILMQDTWYYTQRPLTHINVLITYAEYYFKMLIFISNLYNEHEISLWYKAAAGRHYYISPRRTTNRAFSTGRWIERKVLVRAIRLFAWCINEYSTRADDLIRHFTPFTRFSSVSWNTSTDIQCTLMTPRAQTVLYNMLMTVAQILWFSNGKTALAKWKAYLRWEGISTTWLLFYRLTHAVYGKIYATRRKMRLAAQNFILSQHARRWLWRYVLIGYMVFQAKTVLTLNMPINLSRFILGNEI